MIDWLTWWWTMPQLAIDEATLRAEAIEWQAARGARSGRVAWQFITDLAGRRGVTLG